MVDNLNDIPTLRPILPLEFFIGETGDFLPQKYRVPRNDFDVLRVHLFRKSLWLLVFADGISQAFKFLLIHSTSYESMREF
jgi:hypothetical protein